MKAEDLLSLAAARGVDLIQAAQAGTDARPVRELQTKGFNGHTVLLELSQSRARGKESPSTIRPFWSMAELGQAAAGVRRIPYLAACFAWAGDRSNFWVLHRALHREALALQHHHAWPSEVEDIFGIGTPYLPLLGRLVLDEDAAPSVFIVPAVYALYLRDSEATWERHLIERYMQIKDVWLEWLQRAARKIQSRLGGGPEDAHF